jgi:nucleotide-binding universal stress UspA family protein
MASYPQEDIPMPAFTRILVATDFSDAAEAALSCGRTLASQSGAALDVVRHATCPVLTVRGTAG